MWNKRVYRPLFWALLVSLLVHLALAARVSWLERDQPTGIPIMVELAPAPLVKPALHKTAMPASKPKPSKPSPVSKPKPSEPPPLAPPAPVEPAIPPFPNMQPVAELPPPVQETPIAVVPLLEKEVPAPTAMATAGEDGINPPLPAEEPPPSAPRHVEIEYRILRKGGVAGIERHRYLVGEDGRYSLTSIAEPKGLLALALSDLTQKSEGAVTPQGLKPATFIYQYGKNPDKTQRAAFNWETGKLMLETGSRRQEVALTDGAQDLMSFMYQFMFVPPLQEMQLAITNGKRLKTYAYGFDGEETLQTPFGEVHCLHIGRSSDDGEEKTDLWLAADYHYLPIKISKTEKDGTVLERVATRLLVE
ncbi:MAG TPA: DUF3108 domain-containing protein [Methylophilaceae bacterium]|jgi:hypothetical protein|nr:DUF3108 domain-containing protein [Methylophilaceae bacterium]